ncbi:MAG: xanthine dehydrogenase family protein subunit M [Firmicutes bacterium]|nr:xanthine dehydrogenase family protein subunit M [Alicyclobacillaceae bacterium]MCL6496565.1 xanthine dehydrogenase family protein subunit M [Bacillota bacterium]
MIPERFRYHRARSLDEALDLVAQAPGQARILAGGHSLIPLMKLRLAQPQWVIDVEEVAELRGIREEGEVLHIGAMTRYRELMTDPLVARDAPLLALAARRVGDLQVRNRGTVGGALCHADPAADLPAAALASDAELELRSRRGQRRVALGDFLQGPLTTDLKPDEVLVAIHVPRRPGWGVAYQKFPHPASGYAVVGVAAAIAAESGRVARVCLGVTGVGPRAYRAAASEERLVGTGLDPEVLRAASAVVTDGIAVNHDQFASAEYRRHLAATYAERALAAAWAAIQA